jgi:hypothetical protein
MSSNAPTPSTRLSALRHHLGALPFPAAAEAELAPGAGGDGRHA